MSQNYCAYCETLHVKFGSLDDINTMLSFCWLFCNGNNPSECRRESELLNALLTHACEQNNIQMAEIAVKHGAYLCHVCYNIRHSDMMSVYSNISLGDRELPFRHCTYTLNLIIKFSQHIDQRKYTGEISTERHAALNLRLKLAASWFYAYFGVEPS